MAWNMVGRLLAVLGYPGQQPPRIWYGTQAEYSALPAADRNAAGFIAFIRD